MPAELADWLAAQCTRRWPPRAAASPAAHAAAPLALAPLAPQEAGGWSCSIQVAFPTGPVQAAHGGRRFQHVNLTSFASQASTALLA